MLHGKSEAITYVAIFGANGSSPEHTNDADDDHSIASHLHAW